ncbi:MAG: leucine-rich repeat protein [Eubacterium sp.]|nr:leucine-rich repeat protein [Eubacterium sp.]
MNKKFLIGSIKKGVAVLSVGLAVVSVVPAMPGAQIIDSAVSLDVYAASKSLATFDKLIAGKDSSDKDWIVVNSEAGGKGTVKYQQGDGTYRVRTNLSGYKYNAGDLLSIKVEGLDINDDEIDIGYSLTEGCYHKVTEVVSQHVGYVTLQLPEDSGDILKKTAPKFVRIKGKYKKPSKNTEFTLGGFEIHKAGTLPSWDDGSYPKFDPDAAPKGIAVTYYDGIYSRGFAWSTDEFINDSALYIIEKTNGVSKEVVDWSKAKKVKASKVERTDSKGKVWHVFKAHVEGLKAGATYYYRVGNGTGGFSEVSTLNIDKKEDEINSLTFVHLTDCQESSKDKYSRWANVLEDAYSRYPDTKFVAFTGDLTNDSNDSLNMRQWMWGLDEPGDILRNSIISPSSGNHDKYKYSFTDRFDFKYADYVKSSNKELESGGCYYYTYGKDILFVNLNTNESPWDFDNQKGWLISVLEKYNSCKWKIVQIHKGTMSTGDHTDNGDVEKFRAILPPIFAKYKVDLVLQGHDHVYTRTTSYAYGTDDRGNVYNGYDVAKGEQKVVKNYKFDGETRLWNLEPVGTHYVTINYCANKKYDPKTDISDKIHLGKNPISGNGCSKQPAHPMYGVVRIKGDILCYDSYTYDPDNDTSELYDTFAVNKNPDQDIEEPEDPKNPEDPNGGNPGEGQKTDVTQDKKNPDVKTPSGTPSQGNTTNVVKKGEYLNAEDITKAMLKQNLLVADKKANCKYKITKVIKKNGKVVGGTAMYMMPYNKNCKKATVRNNVKVGGVLFKVTVINKNAFANCKKLQTVVIGTNVVKINAGAFKGCKQLKTVHIKTNKLKYVGKNAFKGVHKKVKFKIAKKNLKKYKKLLKLK